MNVTDWSPMVAYQWGWTLDLQDGRLTNPLPVNNQCDRLWIHFVGTSAVPFGSAGSRTRTTDTIFANFTLEERESVTTNVISAQLGKSWRI